MIYWVDNGRSYSDHSVDMIDVPDEVAADFEALMATKPADMYIVARADFVEVPNASDVTSFVGYFDDDSLPWTFGFDYLFGYDEDAAIEKWAELPAVLQRWLAQRTSFVNPRFTNLLKPAPTDEERDAKALAWREGRAARLREQEMRLQIQLDPTSTKARP